MPATATLARPATNDSAATWAMDVVHDCSRTATLTIGLTNGSRHACDRRCVDELARLLDEALGIRRLSRPMLLVRLSVMVGAVLECAANQSEQGPLLARSPLGAWTEVTIPVPVGKKASWSLENLPRWMANWKRDFSLLLVDLGPMNDVPSRVIGQLCDGCYVLLGPDCCASRDWILQHVAWHQHSGSTICGTLVSDFA